MEPSKFPTTEVTVIESFKLKKKMAIRIKGPYLTNYKTYQNGL